MNKNLIVIKIGGKLLNDNKSVVSLFATLYDLVSNGQKIVIVHGGGSQVDEVCKKLGVKIKKINGRRITDSMTLEIIKMVCGGLINTDLVALALKNKINALGLTGVSGNLVSVSKRPVKKIIDQKTGILKEIDFGYVGDIKKINVKTVKDLINLSYVPIIACLGVDNKGFVFNVNADSIASSIASVLKAEKLIFVSDIEGVIDDKKVLKKITIDQAKKMIENKKIADGMIPKIENVEMTLSGGVDYVQIVGGLKNKSDWTAAINKHLFGTVISGGKYEQNNKTFL